MLTLTRLTSHWGTRDWLEWKCVGLVGLGRVWDWAIYFIWITVYFDSNKVMWKEVFHRKNFSVEQCKVLFWRSIVNPEELACLTKKSWCSIGKKQVELEFKMEMPLCTIHELVAPRLDTCYAQHEFVVYCQKKRNRKRYKKSAWNTSPQIIKYTRK